MTDWEAVAIRDQHQTGSQLLVAVGALEQITEMDVLPVPFQTRHIFLVCDTYNHRQRNIECGCSSVVITNPLIVDQTIKKLLFLHFALNHSIQPSLPQHVSKSPCNRGLL